MAVTLITTVGGSTSNSYISRADAETRFESILYKTNWSAATAIQKDISLVQATRMLDEQMEWAGDRTDQDTQALEFPRWNCPKRKGTGGYIYFYDSDELPDWLLTATCVLADSILGSNRGADSDTYGFKRLKMDVLEIEVDKNDRPAVIPDAVYEIVKFYGKRAIVDYTLTRC